MPSKRVHRQGHDGTTWRCPVCQKLAYSSWAHATWDAREQRDRDRDRRRERPYYSKTCGAFHVGSRPRVRGGIAMSDRRDKHADPADRVVDLHNGRTFVIESATLDAWCCVFGDGLDDAMVKAVEGELARIREELATPAFLAITGERARQDAKWGLQRHSWPEWIAILTEEVGEAAHAAVEENWRPTGDLAELRAELVQVAAVAVQVIEHIDEVRVVAQGEVPA